MVFQDPVRFEDLRSPSGAALDIRHARTIQEAEAGRDSGYEPIECSFGFTSVVGPLKLDHHGSLANEEPVSLKAAKLALQAGNEAAQSGLRPDFAEIANRFQFAGMPDADAVYAALVLSGVVAPSLAIGRAIGELDLDPIGIDRTVEPYIRNPAFEMFGIPALSLEGFQKALAVGARVFGAEPLPADLFEQALAYERVRVERSEKAVLNVDGDVVFVHSDDPSRDVWHRRGAIVVQYKPSLKLITLSGCTRLGAERLGVKNVFDVLGDEGLKPLYTVLDETLNAAGSGGRPDIGGSARGRVVTEEEAGRVYDAVKSFVRGRS